MHFNNSLTGNGPRNGIHTARIGVGDISARGGGETKLPEQNQFPGQEADYATRRSQQNIHYTNLAAHSGHENGTDVDLRYVRSNNSEGITLITDSIYSRSNSLLLASMFIQQGAIVFYTSDITLKTQVEALGIKARVVGGHENHFHIRFKADLPAMTMMASTNNVTSVSLPQGTVANPNPPGTSVTLSFTVNDSNGTSMPEYTVVYLREEQTENIPNGHTSTDLVQLPGAYNVYTTRVNYQGIGSVEVTPVRAGTSKIAVYRPSEEKDIVGVDSENNAVDFTAATDRIGTLEIVINPSIPPTQ